MSSDHDAAEFIDGDLEGQRPTRAPAVASGGQQPLRAPTREEVDSRVGEAQQKLAELKRAQEELERERAALEETRRRQAEFQTGRQEMLDHLTRGVGLLEEAEFDARRDAEQMAKTLVGLRESLSKVQAIHEETWTRENFGTELTRALTTLENARMEWNSARLKLPVLSNDEAQHPGGGLGPSGPAHPLFGAYNFGELCRLGFALTWPIAFVLVLWLITWVLLRR
jgi:hypothetical protein